MTTNPNQNAHDPVSVLRARLEAVRVNAGEAAESRESITDDMSANIALSQLPDHYLRVMRMLQGTGVLSKAHINYVDDLRRIDFAWAEKRIGLRIDPWLLSTRGNRMPDFVYNDAALRERGWLIFSVDPYSPTAKDQLNRVASVVKRVGAPSKTAG
jgi:hypothetical protein